MAYSFEGVFMQIYLNIKVFQFLFALSHPSVYLIVLLLVYILLILVLVLSLHLLVKEIHVLSLHIVVIVLDHYLLLRGLCLRLGSLLL